MPLSIHINGSRGRMGQAVAAAVREAGLTVAAETDVGDDLRAGMASADAVIDFSSPAATGEILRHALELRKPVVIGTTGHEAAERKRLLAIAAWMMVVPSGISTFGSAPAATSSSITSAAPFSAATINGGLVGLSYAVFLKFGS